MKTHRHLRGISFLLSFLMVVSLFTVCGFGALAETKDLTVKTFAGHDLYEAALTDAVKNELDHQIFTSFRDSVGRRSTMPDNFMLHSVPVLRSDSSGNLAFEQGDDIRVTIRVWTDETYVDGNLFQFEFAYNAELGREDLTQIEQIDYDTYMNASSDVDPVTGLEYKEFDLFYPLDHQDFNNPSMSGQLRVKALNEAPLSVYFLGCYNESKEGMVLGEYEGNQIASQSGYNFEDIYLSDVASGVASYCSNDAQIGRDNAVEPYMYNCKGANNDNPMLLVRSLGARIPAGNYALDIEMSSKYTLVSTDKCHLAAWDGENQLGIHKVSDDEVTAAVGKDTARFGTYRLAFTVPEESDGHFIHFTIHLLDSNDIRIRNVKLIKVIDASETMPEEAKAVADAITALSIEDAEGIAQAHADLNALDIIQQAWVGEELINRLVKLESAQTDAAALIAEITAVGNADDITWENYTTYTDKLAAAENFYNAFVDEYGEEDTAKLITNADDLTDLRSAYDAAEDEAKEKEKAADIKAVEDLITAIGPVTEENYESKKEPIEAAEAALSSLKSKYGDAVASDVTNLETLTKAREDYDKFANQVKPEVLYGDVNNDQSVDATDALWVLQHSVELRTLTETELKAADVTDPGKVDTKDALQILQKTVELIDQFDVEKDSFPG